MGINNARMIKNLKDKIENISKDDLDKAIEIQRKAEKYDLLIEKLEKDVLNITKTMQDGKHCDDYSRCRLKAYRTKTKEILSFVKRDNQLTIK